MNQAKRLKVEEKNSDFSSESSTDDENSLPNAGDDKEVLNVEFEGKNVSAYFTPLFSL